MIRRWQVTAEEVAAFLGQGDDPVVVSLAQEALAVVAAMARAYTRGNGFQVAHAEDLSQPVNNGAVVATEDINAVLVTATARLMANPDQVAYRAGDVSFQGGFTGWSLAEQAVLNRYRKRALG